MADKNSRAGSTYLTPEVLAFVDALHAPHDPALERAFNAPEKCAMPAIMVGPSEGKLLGMLLGLVQARRVVEIGTLAGYSAIRMARALPEDGRLWTIEADQSHAAVARANIEAAGLSRKITLMEGAALEVLPGLESEGPFDAVFLDADKDNYLHYGRWALRNLRAGGLLLADNAFFFKRLMEDSPEAAAVRRFHEEAKNGFDTVCVPTPDGLLVGIKKPT
jgi:caffeoyl-CoA O-methyltransferase